MPTFRFAIKDVSEGVDDPAFLLGTVIASDEEAARTLAYDAFAIDPMEPESGVLLISDIKEIPERVVVLDALLEDGKVLVEDAGYKEPEIVPEAQP